MTRLIKIADWGGSKWGNVVFVHGLGGHVYDTWRRGTGYETFWPLWLAEDIEGLTVYSLAYDAPPTNWLGTAMPLQDRAVNVLECLLGEIDLKDGPVAFVCHSLGGLIVKRILLDLQQQAMRRPEAANFLDRVRWVVFAGTPHTGSGKASLLESLRFLAWPSSIAGTLVANEPNLRAINVAYRGLADERRTTLSHRIFYETAVTPAGLIVDQGSADPGLPGDPPVPIDADHSSLVKPLDRGTLIYVRIRQFIAPPPGFVSGAALIRRSALPTVKSERPRYLLPKLIRVLVLVVVTWIGFEGVRALFTPDQATQLGEKDKQIAEKDKQLAEQGKQIDQILQALNETRTGTPPPGSDAALRQAVTNLVDGTSDPRYAEAVELLKKGRAAEAEPLLKAVAEEKEHSAQADAKAAAAAYSNLASISAATDHKRAQEYYAKAASLDPTNIEALYYSGLFHYESDEFDKAELSYRKVEDLAKSAKDNIWLFWAREGLAKICQSKNDLACALNYYKTNLSDAERYANIEPKNTEWQREGAIAVGMVGDIQAAQGDFSGALNSYEVGTKTAILLGTKPNSDDYYPNNTMWRQMYMDRYLGSIGDVQSDQGNFALALRSYNDKLSISIAFARANPNNIDMQRDVAITYGRIGDVQRLLGDPLGAAKSYNDAIAITDRLANSNSTYAMLQHDLSIYYWQLAKCLTQRGDNAGTLEALRKRRKVVLGLEQHSPDNIELKRDLGATEEWIARLER
jgi:tetratricopeptide (TPR) repeat protein/pimeloyl-ACP methyl ester carboxylesterase